MSITQADEYLKIEPEEVTQRLCQFLRKEVLRAGFERVVFGLSGGLDSSVVAMLCARAMGPENVLAVTMPYKTSSDETHRDSMAMIDLLAIPLDRFADNRSGGRLFCPHRDGASDARGQQVCARADGGSLRPERGLRRASRRHKQQE